jgi:hypothetical protein
MQDNNEKKEGEEKQGLVNVTKTAERSVPAPNLGKGGQPNQS